ncbi:MAG: hypothetical protein H8D35_02020 [Nitrosopumilus sp.]|nr:hypothetical protein [Nitrosopumilus sp.]
MSFNPSIISNWITRFIILNLLNLAWNAYSFETLYNAFNGWVGETHAQSVVLILFFGLDFFANLGLIAWLYPNRLQSTK